MSNPFVLSFGTIPVEYISRPLQTNILLENFNSEHPSTHMYMITGVRGSGKTVMLTDLSHKISAQPNWIAVEVSPETDIIDSLVSKLYAIEKVNPLFIRSKITLGFSGTGISLENASPIISNEVILERMLQILKKNNTRLLVTIDEVTNNEFIKKFAHVFQILIRQEYEIYLVMTGLYENIYNLQNEKSLTFLYRTPKISLEPLSIPAIAKSYSSIFSIDNDKATAMAKLTAGYPFAFQVLGFLCWSKKDTNLEDIIDEFDQYLADYVYDKIWSELTDRDRHILYALSEQDSYIKIKDLREKIEMSSSLFSTYRDKLIRKGIVDVSKYGYINVNLPRFREYARYRKEYDEV